MMVTHDVDEALYLSDRVVCMTDGPEATIGEILEVPFSRPRDRKAVMEDPAYPALRRELIGFLEHRAHLRPGALIPPGGATSTSRTFGSDAPESASSKPTIVPSGASAAP
jgi:nitrate/nitrite transport system ATP-binding protein